MITAAALTSAHFRPPASPCRHPALDHAGLQLQPDDPDHDLQLP
jgi:hypothetical protein